MDVMTQQDVPSRVVRPGDSLTPEEWLELPEWDGWLDPEGDDLGEVLDGIYVVSTQPDELHQLVTVRLGELLRAATPAGLISWPVPIGLVVPGRHGLAPDLCVKRLENYRDRRAVPLLVVEVLSPGARQRDELDKRRAYADAGVPSYWIVDPAPPSVIILQLGASGDYVDVRTIVGEQSAEVDRPFSVRLCPAELVAPPS